jgi:chromate reductase, NAD(P)H dehydrogenase (quinone)
MPDSLKIVAISGSLRKGSLNTALVRAAQGLAPADMMIELADIFDLPLYNADTDTQTPPAAVKRLRDQITAADAMLFSVAEYNYSLSGVLKNAIDWASRPMGSASLIGKPAAMMGASPGGLGTARAQYHLRQICVFNNMFPINKPEVFVGMAHQKFDEGGDLKDETAKDLIRHLLANLAAWTRKLRG